MRIISMTSNYDIFEYQFEMLFRCVRNVIGEQTIKVYKTKDDEDNARELDEIVGGSNMLFDISGNAFERYKHLEKDYRYWVEVYILKMIKNLLKRRGVLFEERYHPDFNEKYSLVINCNDKRIEAYFLFDIYFEEANRTDYDKIADALKLRACDVDHISIFVFRDRLTMNTLPWLINGNKNNNANGFVDVAPLCQFFDDFFDPSDYSDFIQFANVFRDRCDSIVSYKTCITPTQRTLSAFKRKKSNMLKDFDYRAVLNKGQSGELTDLEFQKVEKNFLKNKMYTAMNGSNDFADSFISAEWSYDVYYNSMGELELTGIIAGYLKSIEQLMYTITCFHKDEGIPIKTRGEGYQPYSSDNEHKIDSTLGSLKEFLTSKEGKLAISPKVRGCIKKAVKIWTDFQRNGYFHKHNLYKSDNKIGEVREQTIFLCFLLLGGIEFNQQQRLVLGVMSSTNNEKTDINDDIIYAQFEKWFDNILLYDLPERVPGIWILLVSKNKKWIAQPYLMKHFNIIEFESGARIEFLPDRVEINQSKRIPPFVWISDYSDEIEASLQLQEMITKYINGNKSEMKRIQAILMGMDKYMQLIHFDG